MAVMPDKTETKPSADTSVAESPMAVADDHELVETDLLVEEISIDGMCGVY
jgi:mycofactocin precursor